MIDCTSCAQALPISACPAKIIIGVVPDGVTDIVVRFTDVATGRVTVADVNPDALGVVIALTPFDFAPGNAVRAEIVIVVDGVPAGVAAFFPYESVDGVPEPSAYPVTCIVFTPRKTYGTAPVAGQMLILES